VALQPIDVAIISSFPWLIAAMYFSWRKWRDDHSAE
jgi:hypothetical protein